MDAEKQFEVLIAGGGVVGAALARALAGLRVALVSQERRPQVPPQGFDARVYAISPGNAAVLQQLGAWHAMPAQQLTPVHAMRVYGDDGASCIEFDAYRSGVSELAWIVEDRRLQDALWRALEGQEGLSLHPAASIRDLHLTQRQASVILEDGRTLAAQLVVGADGARSLVRERAGIASDAADYGQTAVVANFACSRPHRNTAWQWFQGAGGRSAAASRGAGGGGVLALLPLPGDHVSMVWSTASANAARLQALDAGSLASEVAAASQHALGELAL